MNRVIDIGRRIHRAAAARRRGTAVLLYHRIANGGVDPYRLSVSPTHFAEHLEVVRRYADVVALADLPLTRRGVSSRPVVALTFDDGYADNLHCAAPALERAGTPATVFVTTGWPGMEFWWDQLERVVLGAEALPGSLDVSGDRKRLQIDLAWSRRRRSRWLGRDIRESDDARRLRLVRQLNPFCRSLQPDDRAGFLAELAAWAGPPRIAAPIHRALREEEVTALARSGLVTVGAHTVTHPLLAHVDAAREVSEIRTSRRVLQTLTGSAVESFAYPYGRRGEYASRTVRAVREAGFRFGCTAEPGAVRGGTSPWEIPRRWVLDWNGDAFERQLRRWLPRA